MRRSRLLAGFALAVVVVTSSSLIPYRSLHATQGQKAPVKEDGSLALVEQKQQLCLRVIDLVQKSRKMGASVPGYSPQIINWSRQLLETRIYLSLAKSDFKTQDIEVYLANAKGPANPDRVAAFESYLKSMKTLEDLYRPLYHNGNFSAYDFAQIEAVRVQAEVWLYREQNR